MTLIATAKLQRMGLVDEQGKAVKPRTIAIGCSTAQPDKAFHVVAEDMDECEFMAAMLKRMMTGEHEPVVHLNYATLEAIEDEPIGQDFSTRPYLY